MSINLTQNTYNCFIEEQECFLRNRKGVFDDMAADFLPDVYPSYPGGLCFLFSAGKYAGTFPEGEQELYMEVQAKGIDREYHWISVQLIYVDNPVGGSSSH